MKKKYIHHSHISERKFREIVRYFEHDFYNGLDYFRGLLANSTSNIVYISELRRLKRYSVILCLFEMQIKCVFGCTVELL